MEKELNYKLTGENTELVKGESSQKAIENQSPKGNITNTITVEEVKGKVKDDLKGYYTKSQVDALVGTKLYKHNLWINKDDPLNNFHLVFTTLDAEAITTNNYVIKLQLSFYLPNTVINFIQYAAHSMIRKLICFSAASLTYDEFVIIYIGGYDLDEIQTTTESISTINDTVVEL